MEIRPARRASHTAVQTIAAPPDAVFPLYCPVREADWVRGWAPPLVISSDGRAEVDCFFTTEQDGRESYWLITEHDRPAGRVVMVKITPGVLACRVVIVLEPLPEERTRATITYTYTSLGPEGHRLVADFTPQAYATFMTEWEAEMNHYLLTGEKLCDAP
jgi:hypothetical protein